MLGPLWQVETLFTLQSSLTIFIKVNTNIGIKKYKKKNKQLNGSINKVGYV